MFQGIPFSPSPEPNSRFRTHAREDEAIPSLLGLRQWCCGTLGFFAQGYGWGIEEQAARSLPTTTTATSSWLTDRASGAKLPKSQMPTDKLEKGGMRPGQPLCATTGLLPDSEIRFFVNTAKPQ